MRELYKGGFSAYLLYLAGVELDLRGRGSKRGGGLLRERDVLQS